MFCRDDDSFNLPLFQSQVNENSYQKIDYEIFFIQHIVFFNFNNLYIVYKLFFHSPLKSSKTKKESKTNLP